MILFTDKLQHTNSDYPIVDSEDVAGGLWTVDRVDELDVIKQEKIAKLKPGTLAYIKSLNLYYQWTENNWIPAKFNEAGIPIYTQQMVSPGVSDYILIRDPEDTAQVIKDNIYETKINGNIVDVLFQAVRALQSEVSKLKNSFKYGITSYTDECTAMSSVMGDIETPDEEPLWAIEETDLSELIECTVNMDSSHSLEGQVVANNEIGYLDIVSAKFKDPENGFKIQNDPKSLIFITTSGSDIEFKLSNDLVISLNTLKIPNVELYNILIIVSKKTTKTIDDDMLYGINYVWLQIQDGKTNTILKSGYFNGTDLQESRYTLEYIHYIDEVIFSNLKLYKFNAYTKAQDFSYEVIPNIPDESDYKFNAAHITIRSVANQSVLDKLKNQLLNNELVWVEQTKNLCIKSNNKVYTIGGINTENTMTTAELISTLETLGIIVTNTTGDDYSLELNNIAEVTFVHEETGKVFNITIDSEGNLRSTPEVSNLLSDRLKNITLNPNDSRGFISNLRIAETHGNINDSGDVGLLSDRLKIGAIYAPQPDRTIYGCSHAYIELENTSDQDITLNGCYLHVAIPGILNTEVHTLALKGVIKSGGTFLIRGKKYAEFNDSNTVIKVKTFDQEWYSNGELIDLQKDELCFVLLYNTNEITIDKTFLSDKTLGADGVPTAFTIDSNYIDGIPVRKNTICDWIKGTVLINDKNITRDYILKNTFELDPAKQAFQALFAKDSSRIRGVNKNDFKPFYIDTPIISFPNSDPIYQVELITPKASFENKNVATDKTKLDIDKPNMVYCSFGINMHTTRCFNWISVGSFDEFLWVREKGSTDWIKFESYKPITQQQEEIINSDFIRKEFTTTINNAVYARMQGRFPGDNSFYTSHKCIIYTSNNINQITAYEYIVGRQLITGLPDPDHTSAIQTFTLYPSGSIPRVYHITDQQGFYWMEYQTWAGAAKALANKIAEDVKTEGILPIIINTGDVTQNGTRVNEWLDYYLAGYDLFKQYEHMSVVGNNDLCGTDPSILGTGDDVGKSNGYYHHLFNCYEIDTEDLIVNDKYIPSTYYFECVLPTGNFTRFINVNSEITFINCRDWFNLKISDNVAYNIYTGWTTGNTSPVDVPTYVSGQFIPVYNTLYRWFSIKNREFIVACHEIPFTVMTKQNLSVGTKPGYNSYSRSLDGNSGNLVGSHLNQITKSDTTALYWFSRLLEHFNVKICLGGHKHTYTCTYPVREFYFYGDTNSLISGPMEMGPDLSSEYQEEHLVTWLYTKQDETLLTNTPNAVFNTTNESQTSGFNSFIKNGVKFHTSRLPIVKFDGQVYKVSSTTTAVEYSESDLDSAYLPIVAHSAMSDGVIYFMCQATGYKQTSNKELPGSSQAFSQLLPLTTYNSEKDKDEASKEQQAPMFGILKWENSTRILQLARIMNIQASTKKPLYNNTGEYGTGVPYLEYVNCNNGSYIADRFGKWTTNESNILTYEV